MGKILRVDLTNNKISTDSLNEDLARKFFGGRCLGAKLLFDEIPAKIDPLGPENVLIFSTGPLTGSGVPSGNRYAIITKSPQTGFFLDTYAGGHFGSEIKFAGYDFIIISGRSEKPVYLVIDDDNIDIKDASKIWGLDCWSAETALKKDFGDESARVAVIGPAGEKLVNYALVSNEHHQCGRGGAGAVMGSKKVKGVVIRGSRGVKVANPKGLLHYLENEIHLILTEGPMAELVKGIKYYTPGSVEEHNEMGLLPTYNFRQGVFDRVEKISGHYMRDRIVAKDKACFSCNTPCNKFSVIKEGQYAGGMVVGPDYETLAMLGSNIGFDNVEAVAHANIICDKLGIDTISTGNVIGFITECFEKRIVTKEDVDGLDLEFGNERAVMSLLKKIGQRQGIGDILSKGVLQISKKIGKESGRFAMQVKGMEYPGYVPAASPAFALEYAVTDRGGCHRRAWPVFAEKSAGAPYTTEGRAKVIKDLFDKRLPLHSAIVCDLFFGWSGSGWEEFKQMINFVMDVEMDDAGLQLIAERGFTIARAFNVREGATREDDILDYRTMTEEQPIGPAQGKNVTKEMLNEMLDEYYQLRGWDIKTGIPTRETLMRLGISDVAIALGDKVVE